MNRTSTRSLFIVRLRVLSVFTLLVLALALLPLSVAHAATYPVTNTNDSGPGSLRAAIEQANATPEADTLTLGVNGTITLASTLPTITGELTIDGPGADNLTISGNNAVRVLEVAAGGTLNLEGVTVANGYTDRDNGGGIYNLGTLRVTNSTFSGNSARLGLGGGIYSLGTLTVTFSTFSGNRAGSQGGGIYSDEGLVTVEDSTFSGNSAGTEGGGISADDSLLTVVDSTFTGNTTEDGRFGGGISTNRSTATVRNSTFSNNSAEQGGGIYNRNGDFTVENSTFSGNRASRLGGAIDSNNFGTVTVINSTISANSALEDGGGINNNGTVTVINSTISANSAPNGGGIYNFFGSVKLQNTIIANSPSGGNCAGVITDNGGNLSSDTSCAFTAASSRNSVDPKLDPNGLQNNGGPTKTIALQPGSPAIDAVAECAVATDQRGVARPQDGNGDGQARCDSGAFERERVYQFRGFFQPIDNAPTVNVVNAGRAIPVKFSLTGNQGLNIFAPGYPKSQQIGCSSGTPTDDIEQTVTAGGSSLQYDAASDTYTYVWKTDKGWAGTCRQLIVRLVDGSEYSALFRFK